MSNISKFTTDGHPQKPTISPCDNVERLKIWLASKFLKNFKFFVKQNFKLT